MGERDALQFLLVEDYPAGLRMLKRYFSRLGSTREATTLQEAIDSLAEWPNLVGLTAIIVDVHLPDGNGVDLLRRVRQTSQVPVLVLTGAAERSVVNDAQALGAQFVFKPVRRENLDRFAAHAVANAATGQPRLADEVSALAVLWELTPRETQLLVLALGGVPRSALADELDISENTVKSIVRRLLEKSCSDSVDHLVRLVMSRALGPSEASSLASD